MVRIAELLPTTEDYPKYFLDSIKITSPSLYSVRGAIPNSAKTIIV